MIWWGLVSKAAPPPVSHYCTNKAYTTYALVICTCIGTHKQLTAGPGGGGEGRKPSFTSPRNAYTYICAIGDSMYIHGEPGLCLPLSALQTVRVTTSRLSSLQTVRVTADYSLQPSDRAINLFLSSGPRAPPPPLPLPKEKGVLSPSPR
jgi:hypothetical protein